MGLSIPKGFYLDVEYVDKYLLRLSPLAYMVGIIVMRYSLDSMLEDKGVTDKDIFGIVNRSNSEHWNFEEIQRALFELMQEDIIYSRYRRYYAK